MAWDWLLLGGVALAAALLTLFSGFGLGTLLLPVFALFFPVPLAVAATALVHGANNLFKLALLARQTDWRVVVRFGLPAALAALGGAALLLMLKRMPVLVGYSLGGRTLEVTALKAVIGGLVMVFALLELSPRFQALSFSPRLLPLGGLLSGFLGGLSGHQGALRSAFLLRAGLGKEAFVATGVVCAVIVDGVRLAVYGPVLTGAPGAEQLGMPVLIATACAFAGSFLGSRLLKKITLDTVRRLVAGGMLLIGGSLVLGLL